MAKVLLVSDDLTGALDAGVCLLPAGVVVSTSPEGVDRALLDSCPSALAVNADTRHLGAGEAGERVSGLVALAREAGVASVVKKTDSASSAARATWARRTDPTTCSTSTPASSRRQTACCTWHTPLRPGAA